jgi:hypothetical protein
VRRGQVVVLRLPADAERVDPVEGLLVKRVVAAAGEPVPADVPPGTGTVPSGHIVVRGDGTRSYDSRHWGAIPAGLVEGVAISLPAQLKQQRCVKQSGGTQASALFCGTSRLTIRSATRARIFIVPPIRTRGAGSAPTVTEGYILPPRNHRTTARLLQVRVA